MKRALPLLLALALAQISFAGPFGDLIFKDGFDRSESQEQKDEPGNGWGTNSASRANGAKQVDLRDGAMHIFIHESADHGVSVRHDAEFTDGAVGLSFKLEDPRDSLGLNFADLKFKEVHAGHLFAAKVSPKQVLLQDLKTGAMDLEIRDARKAKTLTKEQKTMLASKQKKLPHEVKIGEWHDLHVQIEGDVMTVSIDGEEIGSLRSEGIAHPTKRTLRLAVPRNAVVDDVKIWRKE